ncbi:Hpt domain-containing protein [Ralstonia sp. 24A2]|uniref:Hpt domain-containing protein n=1 Tax=Ralstonia sp. 24A2 TaxID=3447364 RepID=UPI003F6A11EB
MLQARLARKVGFEPKSTRHAMQPFRDTPAAPASDEASHAIIAGLLPPQVISTLTELFGLDLQQWRFIVDLFTETVEQDLTNLDQALHDGVDAQIIEASHRIVGSSRMLGHLAIGDAARAIERVAQSVGPYHERAAEMRLNFTHLYALADEFRQQISRCAWPDSAVAG